MGGKGFWRGGECPRSAPLQSYNLLDCEHSESRERPLSPAKCLESCPLWLAYRNFGKGTHRTGRGSPLCAGDVGIAAAAPIAMVTATASAP